MTLEANLVSQAGVWDNVAKVICGNVMVTGQVPVGTTQATALALPLADYVTCNNTVANAGVILPGVGAAEINITNYGTASMNVYPPVGGNVNSAAANAAFALAAGKNGQFQTPDGINWFATHSV